MAVPKTTRTRCRDGSVQARHVIERLHLFYTILQICAMRLLGRISKNDVGMGLLV